MTKIFSFNNTWVAGNKLGILIGIFSPPWGLYYGALPHTPFKKLFEKSFLKIFKNFQKSFKWGVG